MLCAIFTAQEICCLFSLKTIIRSQIHCAVWIGFLDYLSIRIIHIRGNITFCICFWFFVSVRIISCQAAVALIRRIIRCILRSFAAQQIIFCNGSRRCASRSVISSNCNIVKLIVLIFLYRIKIFGNIKTGGFLWHLKLCIILIRNCIYNSISILQCLGFYQSFSNAILVVIILSYITFGVGCSTNQPCNSTHITISIIFMTRDCITCLIRCKILHWIKIICCNCIDISLR